MFYLCSIGSNLDPTQHVSQAVEELLARFGQLRLEFGDPDQTGGDALAP